MSFLLASGGGHLYIKHKYKAHFEQAKKITGTDKKKYEHYALLFIGLVILGIALYAIRANS